MAFSLKTSVFLLVLLPLSCPAHSPTSSTASDQAQLLLALITKINSTIDHYAFLASRLELDPAAAEQLKKRVAALEKSIVDEGLSLLVNMSSLEQTKKTITAVEKKPQPQKATSGAHTPATPQTRSEKNN